MGALSVGGLFDGIGLLAYGLHLAGLEHRWLCEVDPWRRGILERRFPGVPVHADVRDVGARTADPVCVIAGGFPCKGASTAGKREGFGHPETVLWREMRRCIGELRPRYVVVENVANLLALHRGAVWGEVLGDLAALGFDVVWDCLPAAAVGAPHRRDRVFAVATDAAWLREGGAGAAAGADGQRVGAQHHVAVADADEPRTDAHAAPGGPRPPVGERTRAVADADRQGVEGHGGAGRVRPQVPGVVADDAKPSADARRERGELRRGPRRVAGPGGQAEGEARQREWSRDAAGDRGQAVRWGAYEPAIRRWEAVHGPAPEPLVRRVDDRSTSRVERSRLSALGDGVQVQLGTIVGRHILELEERRLRNAA